jgi:hypothetical protein
MGTVLASSDDEDMIKLWKNKGNFNWECISSVKVLINNKRKNN